MGNPNAKWYLVQVVTNYELKVKEQLQNRLFDEKDTGIEEIFLPVKSTVSTAGRKMTKPMFAGYVFVKVEMTDESWFIIRNTQYVTGIVGSSGQRAKPTPIPDSQIESIKLSEKNDQENIVPVSNTKAVDMKRIDFVVGDKVNILTGNFANSVGIVNKIQIDKGIALIETEFLGRSTEVPVPLNEIKKK